LLLEVTLGFVVFTLLLNITAFVLIFSQFSVLNEQLLAASQNFQASNQSIAEAIVSLGSLLDDLDEVSGDLVRPPQISDILAQGLQMLMFSKMQNLFPEGAKMINNLGATQGNTWQNAETENLNQMEKAEGIE
jgi:hypothetical protein